VHEEGDTGRIPDSRSATLEAHHGSVGAENVASGGARFWFTLPEEAR
jgi:hypothetical protein